MANQGNPSLPKKVSVPQQTVQVQPNILEDISVKRVNEVREKALSQSSRSKVLVYAAAIENDLTELLSRYFVGTQGIKNDKLLNSRDDASLSFFTKIELTYSLGLISNRLKNHLHLIRDFRNDCAHLVEDFDFSEQDNRSRIKSAYLEINPEARKILGADESNYEQMFGYLAGTSILHLQNLMKEIPPLKEGKNEYFYDS